MAVNKPLTVAPEHQHQHHSHCHTMDRCKYHFITTKTHLPPILKRRSRMRYSKPYPLKPITFRMNNSNSSPLYPSSAAGKCIKIILHGDEAPPSSFSPPPSPTSVRATTTVIERPVSVTPSPVVSFFNKVQVIRIPSRKEYPEDMKRAMYCSASEIRTLARRNTTEFMADGWDWRGATEEQDMYVHPQTGEYVHPVHVHREYQKRVMQARGEAEGAKAA